MEIWKLTQSEFCTELEETGATAATLEMFVALLNKPGWHLGQECPIATYEGFATAPLSRGNDPASLQQQVLLKREGSGWNIVGVYMDDTAIVSSATGTRGLGTELVLRCEEHRSLPKSRIVSPQGKATLLRVHRIAIKRAVDAGLPVPENVRAEYDL